MPEFQWLAAAFPNFVRYVVVGFALAGFFLLIYVLITPWREFRLIRAGNTSAADRPGRRPAGLLPAARQHHRPFGAA